MRRRHHHPMRVARVARSIDDPLHNVKLDLPEETPAFVQPEPIVNYSILEKRINCNKKENEKLPECEKPQKSNALPIALGSAIPIVAAFCVLFFLHRRHMRKLKEEEMHDKTKSMDFGMGFGEGNRKKNHPTLDVNGEKSQSRRQMSMDLALTSPYLLPAGLRNSRESMGSLSRSATGLEDRGYGLVRPGTAHSQNRPHSPLSGGGYQPQPPAFAQQNQYPSKRDSSNFDNDTVRSPHSSSDSMKQDLLGNAQKMGTSTPPQLRKESVAVPPPAAVKGQNFLGTAEQETRDSYIQNDEGDLRRSHMHLVSQINYDKNSPRNTAEPVEPAEAPKSQSPVPRMDSPPTIALPEINVTPSIEISDIRHVSVMADIQNAGSESRPISAETSYSDAQQDAKQQAQAGRPVSGESVYSDYNQPGQSQKSDIQFQVDDHSQEEAPKAKEESEKPQIHAPKPNRDTLFVPGSDGRRLSMGFRPLPPSANPNDSPEERADRIRSFYKEYFDESNVTGQAPAGGYYEEEDLFDAPGYPAAAAPYHQEADAYIAPQRPFAEPVQRRAMTPPPRMPHNRPPPPRAGSSASGHYLPPPRVGSSASGRFMPPGPRSYTSQSGRMGPPRRPMPPPAALNVLPTPHALKEDAFILPDTFAPPLKTKDKVTGKTVDYRAGPVPYSPSVGPATPLASAYDELAVLPPVHALRNSTAFTALDFAPPKKPFREDGGASDAGSIRSNKSALSAVHQQSIRAGAYRVSRIPVDVVPLKDDMAANLKPKMDIGR